MKENNKKQKGQIVEKKTNNTMVKQNVENTKLVKLPNEKIELVKPVVNTSTSTFEITHVLSQMKVSVPLL